MSSVQAVVGRVWALSSSSSARSASASWMRCPRSRSFGLLISTFMITPLSRPLWDHVPYLPFVQFPWRFLTVQAVFTALATARLTRQVGKHASHQVVEPNTLPWHSACCWPSPHSSTCIPTRLYISPSDVTTERLQLYEMFTANIGTTIRYEYLPRGVVPRLYTSDALIEPGQPMRAAALEGEANASRLTAAPTQADMARRGEFIQRDGRFSDFVVARLASDVGRQAGADSPGEQLGPHRARRAERRTHGCVVAWPDAVARGGGEACRSWL